MPNYAPGEVDLNNAARKVITDAELARTRIDPGCLGRLRGMERRFDVALDLDRTAPNQLGIMKQFGDQALKLDITYSKMIRHNQETMDIANKNSDVNFKLTVLHSIVALGKLCEAILAALPATSKASEFLKTAKRFASSSKDFAEASRMSAGGEMGEKTLKGTLNLFGSQTEALADLLAAVLGVKDIAEPDPDLKLDSGQLSGKAADICGHIKAIALTLERLIFLLKSDTTGGVRLKGAAGLLGIVENLLQCYKSAVEAVNSYEEMMRLAGTIGHQRYHARKLRGSGDLESHASRKAFEHAVYKTTAGNAKMKIDRVDFSRAIDSEAEARNWGMQLRSQSRQLDADLKSAQNTLRHYAELYAAEMADLAAKYKKMLPHQAKLLMTLKDVVDYERQTFDPGKHGSLIGHMAGRLKYELKHYDEVLAKAQVRLDIPAALSEARLRAQ